MAVGITTFAFLLFCNLVIAGDLKDAAATSYEARDPSVIYRHLIMLPEPQRISEGVPLVQELETYLLGADEPDAYYAAKALALLGCNARSALPALEKSLLGFEKYNTDVGPVSISPNASAYEEVSSAIGHIRADESCDES